ncbi:MAG TPA: hypothetical protein VF615_11820 [Longimicrobiaceae bacterium]|jgi:hypothetical protein
MEAIRTSPTLRAMEAVSSSSSFLAMAALKESVASVASLNRLTHFSDLQQAGFQIPSSMQVQFSPTVDPSWTRMMEAVSASIEAVKPLFVPSLGIGISTIIGNAFRSINWENALAVAISKGQNRLVMEQQFDQVRTIIEEQLIYTTTSLSDPAEPQSIPDALANAFQAIVARLQDLILAEPTRKHLVQLICSIFLVLAGAVSAVEYEQFRTKVDSAADRQARAKIISILEGIRDSQSTQKAPSDRARVLRPVHLRVGPDTATTSRGLLEPGDEVIILGRAGDWIFVSAGMPGAIVEQGWVYGRRLKALP